MNIKVDIEDFSGMTLGEFIRENEIPEDAEINNEYYDYGCGCVTELCWSREETDEEYKIKINNYEEKLNKYNKWYNINKTEIEEELKRREEEALRKEKKVEEIKSRKIEKEKTSKIRKLKSLAKELGVEIGEI